MKHKIALVVIIVIVAIVLMSLPQTQELLSMYQTRFTDKGTANDFSSGRLEIWRNYLSAIFGSVSVITFGNGFIRSAVVPINGVGMAAHNTVIQILYQGGFIGTIALIAWLKSMRSRTSGNTYKMFEKIFIALILFAPWLALDKLFFDDFFFFIMLYQTMLIDNRNEIIVKDGNRGKEDEYKNKSCKNYI